METEPSNTSPQLPLPPNSGANQFVQNKDTEAKTDQQADTNKSEPAITQQKDPEVQRQINELRIRDQEVRAHELAHMAAAGGLAKGGPSFEYQRGPDGQLYAVSGEVQIDTSSVSGDPEATLQKAQQIQRAALAPAQPSSQDRSVAIAAAAMAAEARAEIASQNTNNSNSDNDEESTQRIVDKINAAYSNNTTDTDLSKTLVNLTV
ncbi:MAG: putative metalloprotease CJM1_0395 family protein [Nitrosomonas sp.]|nr:putative metalloprotease CJM1_0395 family protein [Nitrosomonas sp.]